MHNKYGIKLCTLHFCLEIQHLFFAKENDWGFSNFKEWSVCIIIILQHSYK